MDDMTEVSSVFNEEPTLDQKLQEALTWIGSLEARIEKLEADNVKLKSGMPQIKFD